MSTASSRHPPINSRSANVAWHKMAALKLNRHPSLACSLELSILHHMSCRSGTSIGRICKYPSDNQYPRQARKKPWRPGTYAPHCTASTRWPFYSCPLSSEIHVYIPIVKSEARLRPQTRCFLFQSDKTRDRKRTQSSRASPFGNLQFMLYDLFRLESLYPS